MASFPVMEEFGEIDVVVPIPLSNKRLAQRGYNQAKLLAEPVARSIEVPSRNDILYRHRDTPPQSLFWEREKRKANIKGVFGVKDRRPISDRTLLVIDDVLTTGATVSEAAGVLIEAGARSVHVLTLARAGV
jgi:ComF family protein